MAFTTEIGLGEPDYEMLNTIVLPMFTSFGFKLCAGINLPSSIRLLLLI